MKKKKKRKTPLSEDDTTKMVASNIDPSLLVRVPQDHRINVEGVLDEKLQSVVAEWGQNDSSPAGIGSSVHPAGNGIGVGLVAPQSGYVVALDSENEVVPHGDDGDKIQVVSKNPTVAPVSRPHIDDGSISEGSQVVPIAGDVLVFKAGGSGSVPDGKFAASTIRRPKDAAMVKTRARHNPARPSGTLQGVGSAPNRAQMPTPLPNCPGVADPGTVPAGSHEGVKVRPQFADVLKDNRIVGNGLKLQQYDPMENEDDVVLAASDEIPFVETWGYCLIGCFTGPFPGRHALDSLVKSCGVKCRIIPYGKGWTVFRFATDDDRFRVFNGGPYLAYGKTLMLRLVDAGVILADDLFTSVPTWVLFHDVPLSVWSESGLSM
ncbi:hypothetical protein LIER_28542 [Lithospermum erythrorhizon]|uniref:DUF4283 domain-containing protein n=1 Tax=Lithospermum erythrorhizon TaxID=34254 RepID=A0AAV3RK44_LITER